MNTNQMLIKSYKTEKNDYQRIYISCCKTDFVKHFKVLADKILSIKKCNIYYLDNEDYYPNSDSEVDEHLSNLNNMNLFIFPISINFLSKENISKDIDFSFAFNNNFPILPIFVEPGLFKMFNDKCGNIQGLDMLSTEEGDVSFDAKLRKYIESVLVSDEIAKKIRDAFDAYIFLSYRKKDRNQAQEIMSIIHKNDFMRDVAIWYDENLTPGRDFNNEIKAIMEKSDLVSFVITPNINEEKNYVLSVEYPSAVERNKVLLPIESTETDRDVLKSNFKHFTNIINKNDEQGLADRLKKILFSEGIKDNDDPEHIFFIGLAYLNAIDVERDCKKAISLLEKSANNKYVPAINQLVTIYENGNGVSINYQSAIEWQKKLCNMAIECDDYLNTYLDLSSLYRENSDYRSAIDSDNSLLKILTRKFGMDEDETLSVLNSLALDYDGIGNFKKSIEINEKCYKIRANKLGNDDRATLISMNNLALSYMHLRNYSQALKFSKKCYESSSNLYGEEDDLTLISLNNYALACGYVDKYDEEQILLNKCYKITKEKLGEKDLSTLLTLNNIGVNYIELGQSKIAIDCLYNCYENYISILGENHPSTILPKTNIAYAYKNIKDYPKAIEIYEECYELYLRTQDEKSDEVLSTLTELAELYNLTGNYSKALEIDERCYKIYYELYGDMDYRTTLSIMQLAIDYFDNDMFSKGTKMFFKGLKNFIVIRISMLFKLNIKS